MAAPIALQLYTLREALAQDFAGVIRKVADLGYVGVETAGFPSTTAADAARLFDELGLQVSGAHSPLPLGEQQNQVLDTMAALGCRYLICPWLPPEEFKTLDGIKSVCDRLNEADGIARDNGLTLFYHNHWWEYLSVEGHYAYQVMLDRLNPTVKFEVDTYWVQTAGLDPAAVLRELGDRAPLLHIKDGPAQQEPPMVAVGDGVMDWAAVMEAARAEWLIVELDRCATDMLEAVTKSYAYLTGKGYAHGRKS